MPALATCQATARLLLPVAWAASAPRLLWAARAATEAEMAAAMAPPSTAPLPRTPEGLPFGAALTLAACSDSNAGKTPGTRRRAQAVRALVVPARGEAARRVPRAQRGAAVTRIRAGSVAARCAEVLLPAVASVARPMIPAEARPAREARPMTPAAATRTTARPLPSPDRLALWDNERSGCERATLSWCRKSSARSSTFCGDSSASSSRAG